MIGEKNNLEIAVDTYTISGSCAASTITVLSTTPSKQGYTPIGVLGYRVITSGGGGVSFWIAGCWVNTSNQVQVYCQNTTSNALSVQLAVIVLFKKN